MILWTASRISAALAFVAGTALAQSADKVGAARTEAIRKLDLQLDFPTSSPPPRIPDWHWNFDLPPAVLWVLLAICVALALWWLREPILGLRFKRSTPSLASQLEAATTEGSGEPGLGATADALARAGRYAEAIHELLLQGLSEIHSSLQEKFADSLTSREILRSTRLTPNGRHALAEIVARVELSHFGGRAVGEADYLACRRSFDDLGTALAGAADR